MRNAFRCLLLLLAVLITLSWIPVMADTGSASAQDSPNQVTVMNHLFDQGETLGLRQEAGKKSLTEKNEEHALRLTDGSSWGIWELATADQLKGALSFTLAADIRLDTFSTKGAQVAIRLNQSEGASGANINGATVIQLYRTASDTLLIGGNRNEKGWVASGNPGGKTQISAKKAVTEGAWFRLEIVVNQVAKTCTVTLIKDDQSVSKTFEHITDAESNLSLVLEKQSSLWDNLTLTATYAKTVDLLGVQMTEAVGETYGLRFSARIRTDSPEGFSAVGMKIVATYAGGSRKFNGESGKVWRSIMGKTDGADCVIRALDWGAASLFCVTLTDIPTDVGSMTFTVTPYARTVGGDTVWFDACTVTVADGMISQ